ncbi:MAG: Release factor glutamine methyltransferase [Candidatus Uhrbacteria bacterium GW2011_GWF2_39_13]|uniref:Release factor glutamine methyltransferase n=1 Tax=Candidatus Uhrbacteria bacterium GW2011_GWF2_39_13 TaxID=1618995 RepID=A0A0G0MVQ8_9BACT|nr:MAG: Release factor glutamine methyltransferase [Candidatus Uhrbacteria bacterium GW2011_GWF2_39_13]
MTVMEALQWANNKLRKSNVDSPMLDAEILLAFVLEISKAKLFSRFNEPLKTHHSEHFCELVNRRALREPVAYLIGKKSFYGREFEVNHSVLIPRPETETLIEHTLTTLQEKKKEKERTLIADIGTGSGVIAITIAEETHLPVIAIDIDPDALAVAKKNATNLAEENGIEFQCGNLLEPLIKLFKTIRSQKDIHTSDVYPFKTLIITANLPYLAEHCMETLQPEIQKFEPRLALVSGADGLDAYWELFRQLKMHQNILPREIVLLIEIDPEQRSQMEKMILHNFPEVQIKTYQDLHKDNRVMRIDI